MRIMDDAPEIGHDECPYWRIRVIMRLEKLAKDEDSSISGCPTVYLAEDGSLAMQGDEVDQATYGNAENLLAGERIVRIKTSVVLAAVERYRAR